MLGLKQHTCVHGSAQSSFSGLTRSLRAMSLSSSSTSQSRQQRLTVEARRECQLTGKVANNGYVVTFSHKRNKKLQGVNLQEKKVYWPEKQRWVKVKISTRAMKTIEKKGLQVMANEIGLDLNSLPYRDARPGRVDWLAANAAKPAMSKKGRKMTNPERLAASKKQPRTAKYIVGNRIVLSRDD